MTIELVSPENITENTLVRICGQCGVTFTKENSAHYFQPNCNHCTSHPATYEKYNKLLAFIKDIKNYQFSDSLELPAKEFYGENIFYAAKRLLKEIGE